MMAKSSQTLFPYGWKMCTIIAGLSNYDLWGRNNDIMYHYVLCFRLLSVHHQNQR